MPLAFTQEDFLVKERFQMRFPLTLQIQNELTFNGCIFFFQNEDWGACIYKRSGVKQTPVTVKKIRLAHFIKTVLNHTQIPVVKMDVEGEEYAVLEDMASEKILCQKRIKLILVEYHGISFKGNNTAQMMKHNKIQKKIQEQNCEVTEITRFDDETYLHDVSVTSS